MAKRPIFMPAFNKFPFVEAVEIEFRWHPGFSISQARKSIDSLHEAAAEQGIDSILEISSKSKSVLGVSLSAFNLPLQTSDGQTMSVECAYQGSKVFEKGGPYDDLYAGSSRAAKTDARLRNSGALTAFNFCGEEFPLEPKTAFYDWLYITALRQKKADMTAKIKTFQGFSDIVFNPARSINCQARAAALFVALSKNGLTNEQLENKDRYLKIITGKTNEAPPPPMDTPLRQPRLFE